YGTDRHSTPHRHRRSRARRGHLGVQASSRCSGPGCSSRRNSRPHQIARQPLTEIMFNRSVFASTSATLCVALLLVGCANQLPQRSEHEARTERQLLDHSLRIEVGEPLLELPQRRVRILDQKTFEVTDFEVSRRYDRYTPYQAWRELYEIPLGAVAVVAGVGANVLNVVLLGNLPESATRGWISYGFAGLNPFINTESNGRAQQN